MRRKPKGRLAAIVVCAALWGAAAGAGAQSPAGADPIASALQGHVKPTVEVLLDHCRTHRRYSTADFPLTAERFKTFRDDIRHELAGTLHLEDRVVRGPRGKTSSIAARFEDRLVETKVLHGVTVEIHVVTIRPTGLAVPMVVCLPAGDPDSRVPGVCVFSGHSPHGLHDLVVNIPISFTTVATRCLPGRSSRGSANSSTTGANDDNVEKATKSPQAPAFSRAQPGDGHHARRSPAARRRAGR